MFQHIRRAITWLAAIILIATLASCGGSTASGQCEVLDPGRSSSLPNCTVSTVPGSQAAAPTLTLSLTDAAGATVATLTPQRSGVLQAMLKDARGNPVSGVAVVFSTNDKTATLVPASGSALTDTAGVARIGIAAGTQAGGFSVTAGAAVNGTSVSATIGYAVSFPTLTLSALTVAPSPLSAGGTASLAVTVMDGTQPFAPAQSVSFTSPCAAAGKATISSPVTTVGGVASTSYIDKGCGAADTITATTSLGGVSTLLSGVLNVLPASAGQLVFISAQPLNIALKGTGGPGRQESSVVTFKVLDKSGNPVAGAAVRFSLSGASGTGGVTLGAALGSSGADGTVSTVVYAGTVNTPIRIIATIDGSNPTVTSVSDQLVVSTGVADQNSFSLSTEIYNVEGASHDGCNLPVGSRIRVSLADHFHNPVPNGTAVSFTAEGGSIEASCLTGSGVVGAAPTGACSVNFCASNPRVGDGRLTILAYALGEESYTDDLAITNTVNRYDQGEQFADLCEPFRNDAAISDAQANSTLKDSRTSACPTPTGTDVYIDSNGDGRYNATGDGIYNGVLNVDPATGQTLANNRSSSVHVRASLVQVMSGSTAVVTPYGASRTVALDRCVDGTAFANTPVRFLLAIRDNNPTVYASNTAAALGIDKDLPGNILPAGTKIEVTTSNGKLLSTNSYIVPNTNESNASIWTYALSLQSDAIQSGASGAAPLVCSDASHNGVLTVRVTTPLGIVTETSFNVTD